MPLSEVDLLDVARLARVFADAEMMLLERLVKTAGLGVDEPTWEINTLARLQRLRTAALADLDATAAGYADAVRARLALLYGQGAAAIFADIEVPEGRTIEDSRRRAVVLGLVREMNAAVTSGVGGLLRSADDVYRRIVGETVELVAAGGTSRRDAFRLATRTFVSRGIPAFTDERGRKWNIQSYVDMATRTGFSNALIRGHEDALDVARLDLVIVQPGPRACDICDKWARLVLARRGQAGAMTVQNRVTGKPMTVRVDDTLDAARAAGFQHPNCRCSLRAFIPGATKRETIERPPFDREGYERQQQQRAIERRIREAKTRAIVADATGDAAGAARARAQVRATQARLREHLAANPYLKRRNDREQVVA